tara:strand:+ start:579 stop:1229 length:651 start_codon:yes stop_codon:yes gene_type:complete
VLDKLKERLLDGHYAAGSRISIDAVCDEFAVSKQPVMDAVRRLETLGLVDIAPQSGCRIARYSLRETEDFFSLFAKFEGEIAAAAASRRTNAQVAELDAAWDRVESIVTMPDPAARSRTYRALNRDYHLLIHSMANSRIMAELSERMWDLSDFLIATVGGVACLADAVHDRNHDHDIIRQAITAGNEQIARAAMESHIVGTLALLNPRAVDTPSET